MFCTNWVRIMTRLSRRQFLGYGAAAMGGCFQAQTAWPFWPKSGQNSAGRDIRGHVFKGDAPEKLWPWHREGFFYTKLPGQKVVCGVCPNRCVLAPGDRSVCRSKINHKGVLYSLTYGNPCAVHVDPIEKKPLFHFHPRSSAFSIATTGCNLRCLNCQNWEISQAKPEQVRQQEMFPAQAVGAARGADCKSIAYTYSEATTFFEYMYDIAKIARQKGLNNLLISNGYINKKPLSALCEVLDAANINLKSFSDETYRSLNGGRLKPVLNALQILKANGIHFEITTLVVPGYVDNEQMFRKMCTWIVDHLGPDHPLHLLRFFPRYKLKRLPPTPVATLVKLRDLAQNTGLRYVYIGNVPGHAGTHTYCHNCGKMIIERRGYLMPTYHLKGRRCRFCDTIIPGVWPEATS